MKKGFFMKGLAVGVIALFIGLTAIPVFGAAQPPSLRDRGTNGNGEEAPGNVEGGMNEGMKVEVTEYLSDGTCVTRLIWLSRDAIAELEDTFGTIETVDEGVSVLKKYGLVREDMNLEEWRDGMLEKAKKLRISPLKVLSLVTLSMTKAHLRLPVMVSFLNKVDAVYVMSTRSRIGVPPYRGLLKLVTGFRFVDLVDRCRGMVGIVNARNLLRQHSLVAMASAMGLAGFVGIHISIPYILNIYSGFSAMTVAAGLGMHTVQPFHWLPSLGLR